MKSFLLFAVLILSQSIYCQEYYLAENISEHGVPNPKELVLHEKTTSKVVPEFYKSSTTYSSWTHFFDGNYVYFLGRIDSNSDNCLEYRFEKFSTKSMKVTLYVENKICEAKTKWTYLIINKSLIVLKDGIEISNIPVEKLDKTNIWQN